MNKKLFGTTVSMPRAANTVNEAGGIAYKMEDRHALAQYLVTGTFNGAFYASAEDQLESVKNLVTKVDSQFLAKAAVYAHQTAKMKDTPSFILAVLVSRGETELVAKIFNKVITNAKMLCNFVTFIRTGVTGRKSFGTATKRLIQKWIQNRTPDMLFNDSIGHANPSLADIIKMVHPTPENANDSNMYAYILGKTFDSERLPNRIQQFEELKENASRLVKRQDLEIPDVDFRALSNLELTTQQWKDVARHMKWNTLRMNLNTLNRKNVLDDKVLVDELSAKISDPELVRKFNAFPYQLLTTFQNTENVPQKLRLALQDAMELATSNVPSFGDDVAVMVDISGSMQSPVTGHRAGSTSVTTCRDVASLMGCVVLRNNQNSVVLPFDTSVHPMNLNPRDSVMTNVDIMNRRPGGGTDCACAVKYLNTIAAKYKTLIMVSDNMSWADFSRGGYGYSYSGTTMAAEWNNYKNRVKGAKLILIDIQPYSSVQVENSNDVLNVGGFSDTIWGAIDDFVKGNKRQFVDVIEGVAL